MPEIPEEIYQDFKNIKLELINGTDTVKINKSKHKNLNVQMI